MAHEAVEYVPDNADGSSKAVSNDGIPYRYEHVPDDSTWDVQTVVPLVPVAHLNTYHVPGPQLGYFLADMDDDEHAERVISVRRLQVSCCRPFTPALHGHPLY